MKKWLIGIVIGALGFGPLVGCDDLESAVPAARPSAEATTPSAEPSPSPEPSPEPSAEPSPTPEPSPEPVELLHRVTGVIDGDTIDVEIDGRDQRIRIIGIDTPEREECGYQEAASAMQSLVQSREVRLEPDPTQDDVDQYGRLLRHVFTVDGVSVAEALIAQGLGREYTYSAAYTYLDRHVAAETAAAQASLGVWGGGCDPEPIAPLVSGEEEPEGECLIKGNISRKKEKIYHVPGQRHYEETQIDEYNGEMWFCTEQEARDAGWRKSKR